MTISVIICTYNREELLESAIQSILSQKTSDDSFELIVVDNNSSDNTLAVVKKHQKNFPIKYFFEKNQGLSYAKNRGIREAKSDYVVFLDDDAKAEENWLEEAKELIEERGEEIFGGPIYPFYTTAKPKWFKDFYGSLVLGEEQRYLESDEYLYASNLFIKKTAIGKIGDFDVELGMRGEKMLSGEETELQERAKKIGYKIFYSPKLKIFHLVPKEKMTLEYICRRHFLSSKVSYVFLSKGLVSNLFVFMKNIVASMVLLATYFVRDRKKYPFWQNYLVEKYLHRTRSLIWLTRDFVGIFKKQ